MGFLLYIRKFCILDIITVIGLLVAGYCIEYAPLKSQNYPWAYSFIDQKTKLGIFSYGYLCIFTYGIGSALIILLTLIFQSYSYILKNITSYLFSISFSCFVTSIIKKIVQRPMPDTEQICTVASVDVCSFYLTGHDLIAQFTSFPSRSACEAAASGIFLTNVLIDYWKSDSMFSALFKVIPIVWSLIVGAVEIVCRRAYPDDVLAGLLLGSLVAYFSYKNLKLQGILSPERKEESQSSIIPRYMYL
ncbi:PAP2 superfamily protein [Trichomonas vaginalis G3]|uniref:PAP2 superfamily protein n=1 Tax=Trichomonas vaginalis (strain ATCC PRA-98 / G3) TaxID=412133 RepID=A2EZR4_TRIV3|nr:phosphatidate phosphatase protein [Trichomonas vaginalis G3]EAY01836.1 PAP2 superfamily protein [Trichomonas vaginalis G3]KAI5497562.1 phosphatidate phosphatase protein [Trichomonas vaginalis G3]|eukprot:XP_001314383.1 PAP2 superfamily protein [Trichomonas vaginalis G3]